MDGAKGARSGFGVSGEEENRGVTVKEVEELTAVKSGSFGVPE